MGGSEEDGVQEKTPTGQSSETVVESEEELTVAGSLGIRVPRLRLTKNQKNPDGMLRYFRPQGQFRGTQWIGNAMKEGMCPLPVRCDSRKKEWKWGQEVDTGRGLTFMKWLFCAEHQAHVYHHWICIITCERRKESSAF